MMRYFLLGILLALFCFGNEKIVVGLNGGILPQGVITKNWNTGFFLGFDADVMQDEDIAIIPRSGISYTYGNLGFGDSQMQYHSVDFVFDAIFGSHQKENIKPLLSYICGIGGGYVYANALNFRTYHAGSAFLRLGLVLNITQFLEINTVFSARLIMNTFGDGNLDSMKFFINRVGIQIYERGLWMIVPELSLNLVFKFNTSL